MKSREIEKNFINKIVDGSLKVNSKIPSEAQLAITYGCNRHTIRKVIEGLVEKGYLRKTHKGPTYVNSIPSSYSLTLSSFYELHKDGDINTDVLRFKIIKATEFLSNTLNIDINAKVWNIVRVRYVDNMPSHIEKTYMPYSLFETLNIEHCKKSILSYIEDECGYEVSHSIKTIKAINLGKKEAQLLNLAEGDLALEVDHVSYLTNGRVYEYSVNIHGENNIIYYAKR